MRTRNRNAAAAVTAAAIFAALFGMEATAVAQPRTDGDFTAQLMCTSYPKNQTLTRSQVIARAQSWIDAGVRYNQGGCYSNQYGNYRMDCSGMTSMAWGLTYSLTTWDFHNVAHEIPRSELKPGDALNKSDTHIAIFAGWSDAARTRPIVLNHGGDPVYAHRTVWSQEFAAQHTPIRYNNIVDDLPSGSSLSGDGRAEIAKVGADGKVIAWRNDNGFADTPYGASAIVATDFTSDNVRFADLDGDGKSEIIKVGADGKVVAWRNERGFAETPYGASAIIATDFTSDNVRFADLDGDRKAEIIKVGADGNVVAWRNERGFAETPYGASAIIATEFSSDNVHFADLDGDGRAEIAKVGADGKVVAWRNDRGFAATPYGASAIIATEFSSDNVHFGDLDGDRKAEIAKVGADGKVVAWHNDRGFAETPYGAGAIIATDFTNDNLHLA
ncbi:VCBS repeat-containing protein [Lentzea sp. NPDC051838]|uniref:FG-GAP repeat domain-containing protein n=1 Tax=Lentzea sp. NPDC051838 TaxID=3154849 RepID=UPI0034395AFA